MLYNQLSSQKRMSTHKGEEMERYNWNESVRDIVDRGLVLVPLQNECEAAANNTVWDSDGSRNRVRVLKCMDLNLKFGS